MKSVKGVITIFDLRQVGTFALYSIIENKRNESLLFSYLKVFCLFSSLCSLEQLDVNE